MRGAVDVVHRALRSEHGSTLTYCGDLVPLGTTAKYIDRVSCLVCQRNAEPLAGYLNPITRIDPKWLCLECLNPDRLSGSKPLAVEED